MWNFLRDENKDFYMALLKKERPMNFYFSMSLRSTKAEPLAPIEDVNTVYHSSSSTHLMMLWNGVETTCVPALMVQTIPFPL